MNTKTGLGITAAIRGETAWGPDRPLEVRVQMLLAEMTLAEKVGQMYQANVGENRVPEALATSIRAGRVGSVLNIIDVEVVNELQRLAVEESRLGIPLTVGRDVIHGFKTVMPIPLGQAASWNPALVQEAASVAASEAASCGVNWTFAPMIDISRDPRWGRIAESCGEDPHLTSVLGAAMVDGFQGDDLCDEHAIAACAKHFVGYGAAEAGRDYSTTNIPDNELHNVYLRPFHAAVEAGVMSLMTSFSDLDGVPASANAELLNGVLRGQWQFDGFVVSDWDSVRQLSVHGLTASDRESAFEAATAGVDIEMFGEAYLDHLEALVEAGQLDLSVIDTAVANVLRGKFRLGLFDKPYTKPESFPPLACEAALQTAKEAALQSVVLLKNERHALPLRVSQLTRIAVIGPLANAPYEQLGTWIFDGEADFSITPLTAIRDFVGDDVDVVFEQALPTSRSRDSSQFEKVTLLAGEADAVVLFVGEESILSGEAHSRADISLPGAQADLIKTAKAAGKPVIVVILAGRPLTLANILDDADAVLFAWHPGTMGGPAIADLLFGVASPSAKLPVTFPKMVGQIPIYYNHKNTGRPPTPETVVHIDDIDAGAPQVSLGMTAFHLDAGYKPQFAFGYGLAYTEFEYRNIAVSANPVRLGDAFTISADVINTGGVAAVEVVQLYLRDLVGSVTRPVRELKGFQRVEIQAGQSVRVEFNLTDSDLAFYGRNKQFQTEPGAFHAWIGGSSEADLQVEFQLCVR